MSKSNKKNGSRANGNKIATPKLETVASSPEFPPKEETINTRVSIRRSSNSPSLTDIAEGKSDNKSLKSAKSEVISIEEKVDPKEKVNEEPVIVDKPKAKILEYTPLSEIYAGVEKVTKFFHTGTTHSIQFRLNQLRNLYFMIKDNQQEICYALELDFNRNSSETRNYEISTGLNELIFTMSQLHKWSKPEPVSDLPLNLQTQPVYVEKIPIGVILVIAAFNYPFFVSISPIVGAIAGGNTVVYKPSELTPNFSKLFTKLLTESLPSDLIYIVNGEIPETTELLNQKFDKIIFTGSGIVGKIIARKAAETLTPVVLELGGKSPAIILDDVQDKDLKTIARRIAWGRFVNAGQTCIGVDYVLVPETKHEKFKKVLIEIVNEFFPNVNKEDKGYTHLIHNRAFKKMEKIINTTNGNIIHGGDLDSDSNYVAPTIVDNVNWTDSTMKDEIFGPILPIITYTDINNTCDEIINNCDTPLAAYIFTSSSTSDKYNKQLAIIKSKIRSGGLIINDVLMHIALHNAPFGGVGQSGYGSYHGKYSYRTFTHERTTIEQSLWSEFMLKSRYPPYSNKKDTLIKTSQQNYNGNVWFNRNGQVDLEGPGHLFTAWNSVTGVLNLVYKFATK
ncbi:unnamed protein product [Candida verbasci]|uniref:Aldehyde dehydrogenase domain-containing protein n=1 Tax=Candida verbasci TaxID=1227364 RepID=A0A9W4XCB4_9ASCO|nr:unnamed protein product [Candida verbasci]